MLHDKPISHLILILFTSTLGANILGEALRVFLGFIAGSDTIVERALLQYVTYSVGPHMLNLIILSFSFELALRFNLITILGMFVGWYYFKYATKSPKGGTAPCLAWAILKYSSYSSSFY